MAEAREAVINLFRLSLKVFVHFFGFVTKVVWRFVERQENIVDNATCHTENKPLRKKARHSWLNYAKIQNFTYTDMNFQRQKNN